MQIHDHGPSSREIRPTPTGGWSDSEQYDWYLDRVGELPPRVAGEVETQLAWMREAGLEHVECMWRWRGMALLMGRAA